MWESPIYRFEEETSVKGKIAKKPFLINVTFSAPRNLDDPLCKHNCFVNAKTGEVIGKWSPSFLLE